MPETILTDPVRLRQMLMNLVGNAIKFTETGGVKIVARFAQSASVSTLTIEVIDTGIGIAREGLDKIFEPFAQADTSITRRFGGTGLGLTICRRFADLLGGKLSVESEVGVGSIFTLTLDPGPLDGVPILDPKTATQMPDQANRQSSVDLRLPNTRVLVVDDGTENRKLLSLVLGRAGARVKTANNGQVAVQMINAESFDVILMDVEMPVMDGYTAVQTLRKQGIQLPVLALTAHAMKGDEAKCRAAGFSGYLTKPINLDELLTTLAREIGHEPETPIATAELVAREAETAPAMQEMANHSEPPAADESTAAGSAEAPLISSLPTDDPEFLEIVQEFVQRLQERLAAMSVAARDGDYRELARLAHWLKGSGGMAGFDAFTQPASDLEQLAKQNAAEQIPSALARLQALVQRIVIPSEPTTRAGSAVPIHEMPVIPH
jgi:signal transduction histidine kinase